MNTIHVFNPMIAFILISNMMEMACFFFQMELVTISHSNYESASINLCLLQWFTRLDFSIIVTSVAALYSLSALLLYCYFGKVATESFENKADCLYDVNWPELRVKWQKCIVIMIASTQKPRYYHGIGLAVLKLETFSKV